MYIKTKNLNNFEILIYIKKNKILGRDKMPDYGCVYLHLFSSIFIFKRHFQIEVENNLSVEKVETTEFIDDGTVVREEFKAELPRELYEETDSISAFMRKPLLLHFGGSSNIQWLNQSAGSRLATIDPFMSLQATELWMEKIRGYNLMRARPVLQVRFNANPFQQGALIVHFLPQPQTKHSQTRNCSLATISMQPHAIADCRDTGVELTIPYISAYDWVEFHDQVSDSGWGSFYLTVLSPLRSGDNTGVDISVFLHFEDLELAAPICPESGRGSGAKKFATRKMDVESVLPSVSRVLSKGPSVGGFGDIPSLPDMKPSWLLEIAAKAASLNGWSKPTRGVDNVTSFEAPCRFGASSDGEIPFLPLGLKADNSVCVSKDSIYDGDEMSFNFLKTREMFLASTDWKMTDTIGSLIFSYFTGPFWDGTLVSKIKGTKKLTGKVYHPSSILAKHFAQWRGGYVLRLKVIKTQMHTGRLLITFSPTKDPLIGPSLQGSMFSIRQIVDLSTADSFEFHLPYMLSTQYISTAMQSGKFTVSVMNALKGPATVADQVQLLWFLSCDRDFELQVPAVGPAMVPITLESGRGKTATRVTLPEEESMVLEPSLRCVGEKFSSIKQLLARNSPLYEFLRTSNSSSSFTIFPHMNSVIGLNATGVPTWYGGMGGDPYNLYSTFYAFYRGGMRISFTRGPQFEASCAATYSIATMKGIINACPTKLSNLDFAVTTNLTDRSFGPVGISSAYTCIPVDVPYYCETKISPVLSSPGQIGAFFTDNTQPHSNCSVYQDGVTPINFRRASKDDFHFLYFIGVPILFESYGEA